MHAALEGSVLGVRVPPPLRDGRSANIPPVSAINAELKAIERELDRRTAPKRLLASLPPKMRAWTRPARYKGAHGGRGSAKSQTAARLLLLYALARVPELGWLRRELGIPESVAGEGLRWLCVREIQLSLEQSVKRLLKDRIDEYGLADWGFRTLESRIETPCGGVIVFQGMQNHTSDSVKSFEGFDGAWVEEAHSFSERSLTLLRPTIRKDGSELWFTWNPEKPTDPVDKLLRAEPPAGAVVVEVNHGDNPHFPAVLADEMAGDLARDPEKAAHVWGGRYSTRSKASVFKNFRVEAFETPADAAFLFGGDWGFSVDPTVLLRGFIPRPRVLCIDREVWQVGLEIEDTPAAFDALDPDCPGMARKWEIVADSARPETISHLRKHGYPRIVGANKGPGSIEDGVTFLQGYEIIIHPRCVKTHAEFLDYSYKTHPQTGEIMPILVDKKNHTIDSARYMVEKLRKSGGLTW